MNDLDKILFNQAIIMRALAAIGKGMSPSDWAIDADIRQELENQAEATEQHAKRNLPK